LFVIIRFLIKRIGTLNHHYILKVYSTISKLELHTKLPVTENHSLLYQNRDSENI